jgi:hypothetical protein
LRLTVANKKLAPAGFFIACASIAKPGADVKMAWSPKPLIFTSQVYLVMQGRDFQSLIPGAYCVFAILGFRVAAEMRSVVVEGATFTRAMHVAVRQFGFKVMGFFQFCFAAAKRT